MLDNPFFHTTYILLEVIWKGLNASVGYESHSHGTILTFFFLYKNRGFFGTNTMSNICVRPNKKKEIQKGKIEKKKSKAERRRCGEKKRKVLKAKMEKKKRNL